MRRFVTAALLALITAPVMADITVKDPWVRATVPQQKATGAFMQITAPKAARLVEAGRHRALDAPMLLAVIARIDTGHPQATVHEQWMAVGGALTNLLNAAHALCYGGKMLSGSKVRAAPVVAAFCEPGEQLVGWVVLGTARKAGSPKFNKPDPAQVTRDW